MNKLLLMISLLWVQLAAQNVSEVMIQPENGMTDSLEFHLQFQEAFEQVLEATDDNFEEVVSDSEQVLIDTTLYQKVLLDFPEAEYAFFRNLSNNSGAKTGSSISILYRADRHQDYPDTVYYALYNRLLREFRAIQKVKLGGNWQMTLDYNGFKMYLKEDPSLKIYVNRSGTTGVKIEFNLTKN
ncbi:MAG TPA: hypothetical protein PLD62_09055 [Candidatus Cloacimonadota bacterium]|nr:hypothetical protein [Candidatus Cloacimonadota bacterium]